MSIAEAIQSIKEGFLGSKDNKPAPSSDFRSSFDEVAERAKSVIVSTSEQLTEAVDQLASLEDAVTGQLYQQYLAQCAEYAPALRDKGRIVGEGLLQGMRDLAPDEVGEATPGADPTGDSRVDMLLDPVLDPFVEGIKEPFTQAISEVETSVMQGYVATGVASCLAGGAVGFVVGRYLAGDNRG